MKAREIFEGVHNECGNLEICTYKDTGCGDCLVRKTLIDAEKSLEVMVKIVQIINTEQQPTSCEHTKLKAFETIESIIVDYQLHCAKYK